MPEKSLHIAFDSGHKGSLPHKTATRRSHCKFRYKRNRVFFAVFATAFGVAVISSSPAYAQVTGTMGVSIELTAACEVNGTPDTTNVDFGDMVFPTQTTLFTQVDGTLSAGATQGIDVICTPGLDASLRIVGGENDEVRGSANRAMSNGTLFVPYNIYADSSRTTALDNNDTIDIVATGTAQTIGIYGRAYGNSMLTAGSYADTVSVSLEF